MNTFFQSHETPVIPDHQLLRRIGEGSYGEVWLARNVLGTHRAVKIVYRENFQSDRPYEREFEGIKQFEPISRSHPGLVDILQIGRNDEAQYFYYVMELADDAVARGAFQPERYAAKTLSKELAVRGRLPAAEALQVGRNLAAALTHLHQNGLVHRDIKPANIIFVGGEPKLADIGLVALVTNPVSKVGTEGYIPPEGAGTIQADIFSLGTVLYEMSTGQDRSSFPDLPGDSHYWPDLLSVVELNEVVVKACAQSTAVRYASADGLRSELEMLIAGRSVKQVRATERQLKITKKVAAVALVLALAAGISVWAVNRVRQRQKELLARAYVTSGARLVEDHNLHGALPLFAEALRLQRHDPAAVGTQRARLGAIRQQSPRLLQFWPADGRLSDVHFSPDGRQLLVAGDRRAWLLDIETGATGQVFTAEQNIETAVFSPDGGRVALAHDRSVTVADVATGTNWFTAETGAHLHTASFSPDGESLLLACSSLGARILDARSGAQRGEDFLGHTDDVLSAAFSPDGSRIVTAAADGTARIWDVKTGRSLPPLAHGDWVYDAAFSPDGRQVVTASSDRTLRIWEVADGRLTAARMEHRGQIRRAHFSPDGRMIISAGLDETVHLWDARTGEPAGATLHLRSAAMQAVFDSEARRVATIGFAGEIKVWLVAPEIPVRAGEAVVSGNGARYVTFSTNGFRIWDACNDQPLSPPVTVPGLVITGLCNVTGERVLVQTADAEGQTRAVQVFGSDGALLNSFAPTGRIRRWWLNPEGTKLITALNTATGREVQLWDAVHGALLFGTENYAAIKTAAFSPDGQTVALAVGTKVFRLDTRSGAELPPALAHQKSVGALAFTPDSARLVTATISGDFAPCVAQVWDARTGARLGPPLPHEDGVIDVRVSRDGRLVATGGEDSRAVVWDAATGAALIEPISLLLKVLSVDFSGDAEWIATATWDEAQVWNTRTGQAVTPPFTDPATIDGAGFCADGQRLWMKTRSGLVLWNLPREAGQPDELIAFADQLGVAIPYTLRWNHAAFTPAQLRESCAAERAKARANLDPWQREQAQKSEIKKDWFAAQFHLERLLQRAPGDAALRERLEHARAQLKALNKSAAARATFP